MGKQTTKKDLTHYKFNFDKKDSDGFHISAPFKVLRFEKLYWLWLISLLISFLGTFVNILDGDLKNCITTGAVYSTFITIIAPFIVEFFVDYTVKTRSGEQHKFTSYESMVFGISILYLLFAVLVLKSKYVEQIALQVGFSIFSVIYSFYMYLVTKMDKHALLLAQDEVKEYKDICDEQVIALVNEGNDIKTINGEAGEIKL